MYEFLKLHQINIDYIIASKIRLFKEKFIFGGLNINCMHQNKYNLLKEKLNISSYSISCFTDDIESDKSIIDISNNVFIIKNDTIELHRENENNNTWKN